MRGSRRSGQAARCGQDGIGASVASMSASMSAGLLVKGKAKAPCGRAVLEPRLAMRAEGQLKEAGFGLCVWDSIWALVPLGGPQNGRFAF